MAYSLEQKETILTTIFSKIEQGMSARKAIIEAEISSQTFWSWIDNDEEKSKQYARACEARADYVFEEILQIADDKTNDFKAFVGVNAIQRDKVKIDARKWWLSKVMPKKYGDRIDMTTNGKDLPSAPSSIQVQIVTSDDED